MGEKREKIVRAVIRKAGSYRTIFLMFNSKYGVAYGYIISKFTQNQTKITVVKVPHRKIKNYRR